MIPRTDVHVYQQELDLDSLELGRKEEEFPQLVMSYPPVLDGQAYTIGSLIL